MLSIRYKLVYIIALVVGVVQILPWNCLGMAQGVSSLLTAKYSIHYTVLLPKILIFWKTIAHFLIMMYSILWTTS